MLEIDLALIAPIVAISAMLVAAYLVWSIKRESVGTPRMEEIASYIQEGSNAFLKRELKTILYFAAILAVILLLCLWPRWEIGFGFLLGTFTSFLAITLGMSTAVRANVRTANTARTSSRKAVKLAFHGGGVIGLSIISLNLLCITLLYYFFGVRNNPEALRLLFGFGLGTDITALFAQLGGGIYTKGADVGADLVGKVEAKIPEDDPRNPAVIADLVGDNVGDCAGRGADLFSSGSDNLIGAMILGLMFTFKYGWSGVLFPLLTRSIAVVGTIIGIYLVGEKSKNPLTSLNIGIFSTGLFCLIGFYALSTWVMHDIRLFFCLSLGLLTAVVVSLLTQYYTGAERKPVRNIAEASKSGAAINVMTGFSYGLESTASIVAAIVIAVLASYVIAGGGLIGFYGVAAAALGITAMKGIIMASDTFGPIVDNADGIVEMAGISDEVGDSMETLDAIGNVTKAITKGYAMGCALLTSLVLLFTFVHEAGLASIDLTSLPVIAGVFVGGMLPFLFSAFAIRAVGKTSSQMVEEVRRQFKEIPGLLEGRAKPDYSTCVDISTKNALKEMVAPTFISIITPLVVGFALGVEALGGLLIATTITGALLAILMINAGGAFDNAKKYIEAGHFGGKGTPTHAAAVVGDTYGDPLKDTAGPSLHILIKLVNLVSLTFIPLFLLYSLL
ncbi:MAG: sodium-translocating pyrophosphatase [Candidatus Bathyarchaeia archaeon]